MHESDGSAVARMKRDLRSILNESYISLVLFPLLELRVFCFVF